MSEFEDLSATRVTSLRERFRKPAQEPSFWDRPREMLRFVVLAIRKGQQDKLLLQSAALAYMTMISLVPLLTAFTFFGARAFAEEQEMIVQLLSQILPYSEAAILDRVREFLNAAGALNGVGFVLFLLTALAAFSTMEETLNRIWNVSRKRPFRGRLLSFSLLLFWGPLLLGVTWSALFWLGRQPAFAELRQSLPLQFVPGLTTLLALTMLYWLVPYTRVDFRSAFGGGALATVLLEALRRGFGFYVSLAPSISIVYGSLGLAVFFLVSIQASWWIVLLGSETAYCFQNYQSLTRERRSAASAEGSWLAITAMALMVERFREGEPIVAHEQLAEFLRLPSGDLEEIVEPLLAGGYLVEAVGADEGYLLRGDPHETTVDDLFELFEERHWEILDGLSDETAARLEKLRARIAQTHGGVFEGLRLIELVEWIDDDRSTG